MPKCASKSRSSQRTISSYFTGVNQRPGAKQVSRFSLHVPVASRNPLTGCTVFVLTHNYGRISSRQKVSTSTDDGGFGAPAKRARLQEERDCQRSQGAAPENPPLSRGAAGICSSTLQKLRGFTCLSEPSVDLSYSQKEQETHEGSGGKVSGLKGQVLRPPSVTHQPVRKGSRRQPDQENDDEEEEEDEASSSKKVPSTEDVNSLALCL